MVPAYHSQMTSSAESPRQTPLRAVHERLGATMISFAGWQMPLRYAGETAEHHAVRRAAGLFDLSHMGEIVVSGPRAGAVLDYALTGFLSVLRPGRDRKSTRLNSSHVEISYAVFCLKKKKKKTY